MLTAVIIPHNDTQQDAYSKALVQCLIGIKSVPFDRFVSRITVINFWISGAFI
jgi:hypothetical protein